jgi:DNA replication ATP-dependent helicase/nuclease Dna2
MDRTGSGRADDRVRDMNSVGALIEKLLESPMSSVADVGAQIHGILTDDPLPSRYISQVADRACAEDYETVEEVLAALQALIDRDPPLLEPKRCPAADRVAFPEIKVLQIRSHSFEALVTTGPFRNREVEIRATPAILSYLWIHASVAAYNLISASDREFDSSPETFFVIEPMRQVNATSIARSLHCIKPQVDQFRRGKGDVTIPTLKGQLIHALFDKMLEGETDLEASYEAVLPSYLVALASVTDEFFDDRAFRSEVLRHTAALKEFVDRNPHLLQHAQLELKRYSATLGIQGRIDAVFREGHKLDILELKTGKRIRNEDHAQLFIYRLLLSDSIRRWQRSDGADVEITTRLLSSTDGSWTPLRLMTNFYRVLDARNMLVAAQHALGEGSKLPPLYEGYDAKVCGSCPSWTRTRCKETSNIFGDRPDSSGSPELEYFRKFTRLVQRERWSADQDLADLLDDSRLDARIRNFRTIRRARIVESETPFTFEFERNTSDLERGDSVLIHAGLISSTASYHGYVKDVEPNRLRVSIPLKNIETDLFAAQDWTIDKFPSDVTAEASHTALYDFLVSPMDERKRAILCGISESGKRPAAMGWRYSGELNPSQAEAVERAASCDVFHLIWGPPGTGKTRVIPEIVRRVSGTVLLGAFTNTAVDKMLLSLLDADSAVPFLRFGRASESPELESRLRSIGRDPADCFTEDLARKLRNPGSLRKALNRAPIVAATAHRASTAPFLRTHAFEMAVVDEAGQLTEPLTLGLILRARRFVLIGDDRQLPPVVRTRGLAHSMFERLKRQTSPTLLDVQYRMHPEIMNVCNRLFYDGRLRAGVQASDRRPPDGEPVEFVPVEVEHSSDERKNEDEAAAVERLVHRFVQEYRVPPESIGVVSPFRAQVVLLRQRLAATGVSVDTVERFQGGERDIMILSFVRSRGTGFVFDERRLNVAITRARRKLVLVAHPDLFRDSKYAWISTYTETLRTVGTT